METNYYQYDIPDINIEGDIAIDTETIGLELQRDRLCVVQIADAKGNVYIIHFPKPIYKAPNLKKILKDRSKVKIFHFARFDIAVIKRYLGVWCIPVYCTKIASYISRTYSRKHGLAEIINETCGIRVNKQQQSSNWSADTLTQDQIDYASNDVIYLHSIRDSLNLMLKKNGRFTLTQEAFRCLKTIILLDIAGWKGSDIFSHDYYNIFSK